MYEEVSICTFSTNKSSGHAAGRWLPASSLQNQHMMKTTCFFCLLISLIWIGCETKPVELNPDEPDMSDTAASAIPADFRAQFAGTYELQHIRSVGYENGDTAVSRDKMITMEIYFDTADCIPTYRGTVCSPSMAFGDEFEVAVREDGRFFHTTGYITEGPISGGFIGTDSVNLMILYTHSPLQFQRDILRGKKK